MTEDRTAKLLAQLNARIPGDVDWKSGALNYLAQLFVGDQKESMIRFHLIKPFISLSPSNGTIREQSLELSRELGFFAHLLAILNLPPSASFLDVACGTGWVSHYLAKLGLRVCGFDISDAMIDLAKQRISTDPWPTTSGAPLNIDFLVHDIEEAPLLTSERFNVAILESALHHFVDPVKVLQHIRNNLTDDGIVVIIEGSSDGEDIHCREVMEQYDTLERPYTPDELEEIVICAGFPLYRRMVPLSAFFHPGYVSHRRTQGLLCGDRSWNTAIAFNSKAALSLVCLEGAEEPTEFLLDASGDLVQNIDVEHWIGPTSRLLLDRPGQQVVQMSFRSPLPNLTGQPLTIVLTDCLNNRSIHQFRVTPTHKQDSEIQFLLPLRDGHASYEISCSSLFSPPWLHESNDTRLLCGRVQVLTSNANPSGTIVCLNEQASSELIADCWMGPDVRFTPIVSVTGTVKLRFVSSLPRRRLRSQKIWVTVEQSGLVLLVRLLPGLNSVSTSTIELFDLPVNATLLLQSTDSFRMPPVTGVYNQQLLSYRLTQLPISD